MRNRGYWYENAIIYCLDVETYMDSDGDGVGDFAGLTRRLDYLSGLGVNCIWLMPFYPTPNQDDGYDVSDYYSIDPRLGNLGDFVDMIGEARERGMRVIVDLVPNHCSIEHPWFQEARKDPNSKYRDYFVWREDDPGDTSDMIVFPGEQEGIWTYDEVAGAYYLHHFYPFQPDLNITNPDVRNELEKIMGLWLQLGVSGFRVDAAPFLIGMTGLEDQPQPADPHQYLQQLRDFMTHRQGDAVFLGEVDVGFSTVADYFGGGNELHLLFNFIINRSLFLSLAEQSKDPLEIAFLELPEIPVEGQWVNWLRHHDETNLSRLTQKQRDTIFAEFGPDENMQIYGRGLRRRLAPMLGGDRKQMQMAHSLMFSLPGTPMIYYGEEIGMGENLEVPGRLSVRTPMQWSSEPNGGFSTAAPEDLVRPMIAGGDFGYERVNVMSQRPDPDSFLNFMGQLIRARKEMPEIGWGKTKVIETNDPAVLCLLAQYDGSVAVTVHNLSPEPRSVKLKLDPDEYSDPLIDLLSDKPYRRLDNPTSSFRLSGFGYRWMRLGGLHK